MTNEGVTSLAHDTIGDFLYLPEVGFLIMFIWLMFSGGRKASLDAVLAPMLGLAANPAEDGEQ